MITQELFIRIFGMVSIDFFVKVTPPVLMFCLPYECKRNLWLRALFILIYVFLYSTLTTWIGFMLPRGAFNFSLYTQYILLHIGIFIIQWSLFKASTSALLFNLLGGYALHEICLFLFYIIFYNTPFFDTISNVSFEYYAIQAAWFILMYFILYHILVKKQIASASSDTANNQPTLYLSVGISLFLIAFNLTRTSVAPRSSMDIMCLLCLILFYTLILLFRSGLLKTIETEKEIALTKKIWEEKEKSLRLTMDAVNTINIKYHDLKHIVSKLKSDADAQEYVAEITESLSAYKHAISTGNDTLDMILTEQALKFDHAGISFSCIADGEAVSFMSSVDIISLFSNALDNAYEAVSALSQGKYEVYLTVKRAVGMVSIAVENPCSANVALQNGLPVTTKQDKEYHGFGVKSIRSTVEKYGGNLLISAEDNWFKLNILIPEMT